MQATTRDGTLIDITLPDGAFVDPGRKFDTVYGVHNRAVAAALIADLVSKGVDARLGEGNAIRFYKPVPKV